MSKRIGLFSGVFDPIHIGHVEACLVSLSACDLEQVLVLVEKEPKRKEKPTSYDKRKEMVDMALGDFTLINFFDINQPNITYKKSMPVIKKRFPGAKFCMIVGSDMLEHLGDWEDAGELLESVELCVVLRNNTQEKKVKKQLEAYKKKHPKLVYKIVPAVWSPVSSSNIRKQIAKDGHSDLIHRDVMAYVQKNKLYSEASRASSK